MPCSDGQLNYVDGLNDGRQGSSRTITLLEERNDAMAQMLCYLLSNYSFGKLPMAINVWWKSHQEFDKKRREFEKANAHR